MSKQGQLLVWPVYHLVKISRGKYCLSVRLGSGTLHRPDQTVMTYDMHVKPVKHLLITLTIRRPAWTGACPSA